MSELALGEWRQTLLEGLALRVPEGDVLSTVSAAIKQAANERQARAAAERVIRRRKRELDAELAKLERELGPLTNRRSALEFLLTWGNEEGVFSAVESSALHRALEAPINAALGEPISTEGFDFRVFLIEHDWAAVLSSADVDDGAFRLPFEECCFECRLAGRRVCALFWSRDGVPTYMVILVETPHGWASLGQNDIVEGALSETMDATDPRARIFAQVRAIAITLDAEVVTASPIRAPHKLNVARMKAGKAPIYDHHILTLNRRPRAVGARLEGGGHHKRLHFRRGHWRHYATFKTWIRWCLVGDASLGFADKDYRL